MQTNPKKHVLPGIILLVLLAVAVVFWYVRQPKPPDSSTPSTPQVSDQERAIKLAQDYVLAMKEYQQNNGANLKTTTTIRLKCPGCWRVEIEFDTSSKATAIVSVTLDSWKVTGAVYTPPRKTAFTSQECQEEGGRTEDLRDDGVGCNEDETEIGMVRGMGEEAAGAPDQFTGLVCCVPGREESGFSEAKELARSVCGEEGNLVGPEVFNGITKVMEIAMDIEEEEGCVAFCVVSLVKKTAEIEWRCEAGQF